jgi:L-cysteate sulfo-lyase
MGAMSTPAGPDPQPLVRTPTPLEPAPRLAAALDLAPEDLWLKRDDLGGLGGGGNKLRKLAVAVAEARAAGADTLVTTGAAQSNHARLTAAVGARLGYRVVLVLAGSEPPVRRGNLLLDDLLGARLVWAGETDLTDGLDAVAAATVASLRADGARPFLVPYGGTSPSTALAYVDAATELEDALPDLARVVVAVGSGGTMAGLVHGLGADRVLGVDTGAVAGPAGVVADLLGAMGTATARDALRIDGEQVGAGYGHLLPAVLEAARLVARTEGVVVDATYVGRAAAGLVAGARAGRIRRGERTVLLHTGGLPGLLGHPGLVG